MTLELDQLDQLNDQDFFQMRQLHDYSDFSHEQCAAFLQDGDDRSFQHSPLSCSIENSLVFDFPGPSPTASHLYLRGDVAMDTAPPRTSTSIISSDSVTASVCLSAEDNSETKPRRGRKRLPETVSSLSFYYIPLNNNIIIKIQTIC